MRSFINFNLSFLILIKYPKDTIADAVIQVNDVNELEENVIQLLTNPELLEAKRSLAYNWAHGEAKVLDGIVEKVKGYIGE